MPMPRLAPSLALAVLLLPAAAQAQDRGSVNPKPLPPLEHPDAPSTPAKALFGRVSRAASGPAHIYGSYAKGCFSGGEALPLDGPNWQVMRPSRNRMWGTPYLVDFIERLSPKAPRVGWPGLLVGDMSQPRGGPMLTGHASHQLGLDADVWLTPMPDHRMSRAEREETSATDMVRSDRLDIDPRGLDARASAADPPHGRAAGGGAHLRQRGDQEGPLPRGRRAARWLLQGAPDVRAQLPLPYPPRLPGRPGRLPATRPRRRPATAAARTRLLVQRRGAPPEAPEGAAEAQARR